MSTISVYYTDTGEGTGCGAPIDLPEGWEVDYR